MPSVPSSTEVGPIPSICPHAAKLRNAQLHFSGDATDNGMAIINAGPKPFTETHTNGDAKTLKLSTNGSAPVTGDKDGSRFTNGNGSSHVNGDVREMEKGDVAIDGRVWIRPDLPSRCTWRLGMSNSDSPHTHAVR